MTGSRGDRAPAGAASRHAALPAVDAGWSPATRVAFRLSVLYLGLFSLATQLSGSLLPNLSFYYRGLGRLSPMRDVTMWVAAHVAGVTPPADEATATGEPLFFWVQTAWLLAAALLGTAIWSFLDRRRAYTTLHGWCRLAARFVLAASLFEYGMTKIIPTQFPAPSLETLVTPVGDLTLSALLWTTIGSAPAYEIVTGALEVLGGILLVIPATVPAGTLLSLAAAVQVFALNMTFDIGLKLISFHLILLALFLLAPDASRLLRVLRNLPVAPAVRPPLAQGWRARRLLAAAQIAAGVYLIAMYAYINVRFWEVRGGGRPRSALYGIWNIEGMEVDGRAGPPALNDYDRRWRRVIFDDPDRIVFQRTDDSLARYGASIDASGRTLEIRKDGSARWRTRFVYDQPSPDRLHLVGEMDGHQVELEARRVNFDTLRLLNSRFRWMRTHERGP
jgi:hypothetical protein